jgi:PilZ domain-containing protein
MERRSADRVKDDSRLVVSGITRSGQAFQEISLVRDVSSGGISFTLHAPIQPGIVVELSICSRHGAEADCLPKFQTQARVLRVCPAGNGGDGFLVAARFEGDVVNLAADDGFEAMVRQLQNAVAYDESQRHQFE